MSSLADVAKLAGVSIATASRVLSGSGHPVAEPTRQRVIRAAEKLDYTPNELARSLLSLRSRTIGIVVGSIIDPYYAEITAGVEEFGRSQGLLTMVCNAMRDVDKETAYLEILRRHRVDGIILAGGEYHGTDTTDWHAELAGARRQGITIVAVGPRTHEDFRRIVVDDRMMAHDLATSLLDLGHRSFVFIAGPKNYSTAELRRVGFADGVASRSDVQLVVVEGGFTFEDGYQAVEDLLERGQPLPDAVAAQNDGQALGAMAALEDAGYSIPADVSVAGIDDVNDAKLRGLTTIHMPRRELGRLAAEYIFNGDAELGDTVVEHRFVERVSTRRR